MQCPVAACHEKWLDREQHEPGGEEHAVDEEERFRRRQVLNLGEPWLEEEGAREAGRGEGLVRGHVHRHLAEGGGEGGRGASFSTDDWVRAIRHGVGPDGRVERVELAPEIDDRGFAKKFVEVMRNYRFRPARSADGAAIAGTTNAAPSES